MAKNGGNAKTAMLIAMRTGPYAGCGCPVTCCTMPLTVKRLSSASAKLTTTIAVISYDQEVYAEGDQAADESGIGRRRWS